MTLASRFSDAMVYALALHAQQRRKVAGTPYVGHLLEVTGIVLEYGASEDEAIAALLHDAVEDQGGAPRLEEIRQRFGPTVAEIVHGCTDTDVEPKPPWRSRKEAFLERLRRASASVRLVVAADKLQNARSIVREYRLRGESLWEHFRAGPDAMLWYYRGAVEALKSSGLTPLVEELDRAVTEFERTVVRTNPPPPG